MQVFLYLATRINTARLYHQARFGVKAVETGGTAHHHITRKVTTERRAGTETEKGSESVSMTEERGTTTVNMTEERGITNEEREELNERGKGDVIHRPLNRQDLLRGVTTRIVRRRQCRKGGDGRRQ